jgi:hypothetical protein
LPLPAMPLSSRLQTTLVLGGILFVTVTLTAMFLWMSCYTRRVVIADTYVSSSNLALSVEQFIARTIETVDLSLRVSVEEIGADSPHTPEKVDALLADRVRQFPQISNLLILGPDGAVRFSSTPMPKHSLSSAETNCFILARDNTGIRFTVEGPASPQLGSRHVIVAGQRFDGPGGKFAGVVLATVNSDYIMRFFYTLNIGEQGIIALETTDGTLLIRRPYVDDYIGKNFSSGVLFQGMLPWASSRCNIRRMVAGVSSATSASRDFRWSFKSRSLRTKLSRTGGIRPECKRRRVSPSSSSLARCHSG